MTTTQHILTTIREHGEAAYPEECCGFFLGRFVDGTPVVMEALPVENSRAENRERRFTIAPADYLSAEREASRRELDVVGVYHSHPDHPARPSGTDLAEATFPGLAYVIVPVDRGRAGTPTSWALADDRSRFDPAPLITRPVQP